MSSSLIHGSDIALRLRDLLSFLGSFIHVPEYRRQEPFQTDGYTWQMLVEASSLPLDPGTALAFVMEVLGFNLTTILVSVCFISWCLTSVQYAYVHAYVYLRKYFMSSVTVKSDDDIYEHLVQWVSEHAVAKSSLSLIARTSRDFWDEEEDDAGRVEFNTGGLINFDTFEKKAPTYQPAFGSHQFWHRGRYYEMVRERKSMMQNSRWGSVVRDEETIRLSCVGRSTQPIKDLIHESQRRYLDKRSSRTIIRRPGPKEMRSRRPWITVAKRPSRPIDTVVLEEEAKRDVLADINEYLHPSSARWYALRGIPYRRGYLFHGPPGSGKTSLSFAIAGIIGLGIYCISLREPSLTEEDLCLLFNNLPRRCLVLLEDIDTAGLVRPDDGGDESTTSEPKDATKEQNSGEKIVDEIAKAISKSMRGKTDIKDTTQGISLRGLLNAIDGVASHEGRVLIMTTNHPEKLDEALIKPGRVDKKVAFALANYAQIRQLFTRMYSPDTVDGVVVTRPARSPAAVTPASNEKERQVPKMDLAQIAAAFADRIPADTFTPAEIQGFLLTRKEPRRALDEVDGWMKRERERGKGAGA